MGKIHCGVPDSAHGHTWEATDEEQGQWDRKMMMNVSVEGDLNLCDKNRALTEVQRILAKEISLLINAKTFRAFPELISPERNTFWKAQAVCLKNIEGAGILKNVFDEKMGCHFMVR